MFIDYKGQTIGRKERIYLSGGISNVRNFEEKFRDCANFLKSFGFENVVNPAELYKVIEQGTWEEYMSIDLSILNLCDVIAFMPNWKESKGCQRECGFALAKGLKIIELKSLQM